MIKLYQMPISHYCEKVRWALDAKRIPYTTKNLLPGLHIKPMKKLSGQSSVPVIKDDKDVVAGSSQILDYLDSNYPRFQLTPENDDDAKQAKNWELLADDSIAVHIRRAMYSLFLDHPDTVIGFFTKEGPWYGKFLMTRMFPKIKTGLMRYYDVNANSFEESKRHILEAKKTLLAGLDGKNYLVGDRFSRADLAIAAVIAPLYQPGKYGIDWPHNLPKEWEALMAEMDELREWVLGLYSNHH